MKQSKPKPMTGTTQSGIFIPSNTTQIAWSNHADTPAKGLSVNDTTLISKQARFEACKTA